MSFVIIYIPNNKDIIILSLIIEEMQKLKLNYMSLLIDRFFIHF